MPSPSWIELIKDFSKLNDLVLYGEIYGHLPSGKNNYEMRGQRWFKNSKVESYENSCLKQLMVLKRKQGLSTIPTHAMKKAIHLALVVNVWFRDFRRDVDTILFCDLLQKSKVIKNDRYIRVKLINGTEVDKKNPRIEFGLYKIRMNDDLSGMP